MDSMGFWRLIQNEEAILFLFNGLEDDTSPPNKNEEATHNSEDDASPPKKRGKHATDFNSSEQKPFLDLGLPEHRPETRDEWEKLFQFKRYTSEPPKEVYQGMFTKCEDELKAVKKAYNKAAIFFKSGFGELEKPDVETYFKFKDGPLLKLKQLEDQYYKNLEELAEKRNVDRLVEVLMCNVKSHETEKYSGLTMGHIYGIICFLRRKFDRCYVEGPNMISVEQFNRSEMKEVVTDNKDLIENICSSWEEYVTVEDRIRKEGCKPEISIIGRMGSLINCLKTAGLMLRVMRKQLELLCTKKVILSGYDEDFFDEWNEVSWHYELTSNFYV